MPQETPDFQCLKQVEELLGPNPEALIAAGILERDQLAVSNTLDGTLKCVFAFDPDGCKRAWTFCAGRMAVAGACFQDLVAERAMRLAKETIADQTTPDA